MELKSDRQARYAQCAHYERAQWKGNLGLPREAYRRPSLLKRLIARLWS